MEIDNSNVEHPEKNEYSTTIMAGKKYEQVSGDGDEFILEAFNVGGRLVIDMAWDCWVDNADAVHSLSRATGTTIDLFLMDATIVLPPEQASVNLDLKFESECAISRNYENLTEYMQKRYAGIIFEPQDVPEQEKVVINTIDGVQILRDPDTHELLVTRTPPDTLYVTDDKDQAVDIAHQEIAKRCLTKLSDLVRYAKNDPVSEDRDLTEVAEEIRQQLLQMDIPSKYRLVPDNEDIVTAIREGEKRIHDGRWYISTLHQAAKLIEHSD